MPGLGRYAIYGVLLAFVGYVFGVLYQHGTLDARILNEAAAPLVGWGVLAGVRGGSFVMGLEALVGLLKRKWRARGKP